MRFMRIVLLLPLVFPAVLASAAVNREIADTVPQLTGGTRPIGRLMIASAGATAFLAGASAAGQDAQAVEAGLGLDRPTRRLIQRGLANEGFDPGAPDGLFGPRTRAAIRRWQDARRRPPTGYLDSEQARLLRAAGAGRPAESESSAVAARPAVVPPAPPAPSVNCEEWNTRQFFETATVESVTACLAAGADVAARDDERATPLHWAAWSNQDVSVLRVLLAAGADLEARDGNNRTPLLNAAWNNDNRAMVDALVAAGADIEVRDHQGATPLNLAAWTNENLAVLEALLAAGADVDTASDSGIAPIQIAASVNGNPAVLEALLAAGADRNTQFRDGRTLLHLAASNNSNPAVLDVLLAAGADVAAQDNRGNQPLHRAAWSNEDVSVLSVLLAAGADLEARNSNNRTPLLNVAWNNDNPAMVDALLASGADIEVRDDEGFTPLNRAAWLRPLIDIKLPTSSKQDAARRFPYAVYSGSTKPGQSAALPQHAVNGPPTPGE